MLTAYREIALALAMPLLVTATIDFNDLSLEACHGEKPIVVEKLWAELNDSVVQYEDGTNASLSWAEITLADGHYNLGGLVSLEKNTHVLYEVEDDLYLPGLVLCKPAELASRKPQWKQKRDGADPPQEEHTEDTDKLIIQCIDGYCLRYFEVTEDTIRKSTIAAIMYDDDDFNTTKWLWEYQSPHADSIVLERKCHIVHGGHIFRVHKIDVHNNKMFLSAFLATSQQAFTVVMLPTGKEINVSMTMTLSLHECINDLMQESIDDGEQLLGHYYDKKSSKMKEATKNYTDWLDMEDEYYNSSSRRRLLRLLTSTQAMS